MRRVAAPLLLALGIVLAPLLAGCESSRAAPNRSAQNGTSATPGCGFAVIVPENAFNRARSAPFGPACGDNEVRVRVNGQCLGGTHNTFTVNPGQHDLSVVYVDRAPRLNGRVLATRAVNLPLQAEAGRTYAIRGRTTWASNGQPTVSIWAVDGSTRQTVSSVVVPRANTLIMGDEDWWPYDPD